MPQWSVCSLQLPFFFPRSDQFVHVNGTREKIHCSVLLGKGNDREVAVPAAKMLDCPMQTTQGSLDEPLQSLCNCSCDHQTCHTRDNDAFNPSLIIYKPDYNRLDDSKTHRPSDTCRQWSRLKERWKEKSNYFHKHKNACTNLSH